MKYVNISVSDGYVPIVPELNQILTSGKYTFLTSGEYTSAHVKPPVVTYLTYRTVWCLSLNIYLTIQLYSNDDSACWDTNGTI